MGSLVQIIWIFIQTSLPVHNGNPDISCVLRTIRRGLDFLHPDGSRFVSRAAVFFLQCSANSKYELPVTMPQGYTMLCLHSNCDMFKEEEEKYDLWTF